VPGAGSVPAEVVFVGIAPGRFGGDRTGQPFTGDRSGMLLRAMISATGIERTFITNLVRCNPRDERGRNRDPNRSELFNCRHHLEAELALARPLVVACLGRLAWHELGGDPAEFDPPHAMVHKTDALTLYPMYHPGYVVRGAYPPARWARDFARLRRLTAALRSTNGHC
jgi:uracil-DNA glycosylase family 4